MNPPRRSLDFAVILLTLIVGVMSLMLANDGFHYWHDIRFSYVAHSLSLEETLSGRFNPEQRGGEVHEPRTAGFYLSKVLHVGFLHALFSIVPPHQGGFLLAVWCSVGMMMAASALGYLMYREFFNDRHLAWLAWVSMVLMPITPYLAGKLIAEVPALLFSLAGVWSMNRAFSRESSRWIPYSVISGGFLLLCGLSRLDSILSCIGFGLASIIFAKEFANTLHMCKVLALSIGVFVFSYVGVLSVTGADPTDLVAYFFGFLGIGTKSVAMSLLGILTFGGVVYGFAISSVFATRRLVFFFVLWFVIAAVPIIVITSNYMVEPRYLLNGLLPIMGLGALGLQVLVNWFRNRTVGLFFLGCGMLCSFGVNYGLLQVMPYELDRHAITRTIHEILERDEQATILVPWAYTDFHFLRIMFPDAAIYNVNGFETKDDTPTLSSRQWSERLRSWYGERYVTESDRVLRMIALGSVYYVGWRYYPPVGFIDRVDRLLGINVFAPIKEKLHLLDHLTQSWVWKNPLFEFSLTGKNGQYEYYVVHTPTK